MITKRLGLLTLLVLHFFVKINGQGPPPPAMPSDSNTLLVDKIIQVTNHKKYFADYCTKKVMAYSKENNWTSAKTKEILGSIDFANYSFTIHNSYASYTTTLLQNLLTSLTEIAKTSKDGSTFILTNQMMQSNLDLIVDSIIKGKYVM